MQEKTDQIAEMTEIMKHAVNVDEQVMNETEERLQSLLVENRGLKEILKIKSKYGAYEPNNNIITNSSNNNKTQRSNLVDREVQTQQFPGDSGSETKDSLEISKLINFLVLNTEMGKQEPHNSSQVSVEDLKQPEEDILMNTIDDVLKTENQYVNETTVLQSIENLGEGIKI